MGHSLTNSENVECYVTTAELLRPKKKSKSKDLTTTTAGWLHPKAGSRKKKRRRPLKILLDTGCGGTLVHKDVIKGLERIPDKKTKWSTKAGTFSTSTKCKITFCLPEFHEQKDITWTAHVDESSNQLSRYDMIIGRDLFNELGMDFLFSVGLMMWDGATVRMKDPSWVDTIDPLSIKEESNTEEVHSMYDPLTTEAERIQRILDVKYAPADLEELCAECKHLSLQEQKELCALLTKFSDLFDGSLGTWNMDPVDIELNEDAKPHHAKPFPVPQSQEKKLRAEVERMEKLGVIRKVNRSQWASPAFTVNKPDQTLRFIADFRELNKRIKRKPFLCQKSRKCYRNLKAFSMLHPWI